MKKLISTILSLVMILTLFAGLPMSVSAESEGIWEYDVYDGVATVTGCTNAVGDLVIPDTLGGYPMTSIDVCAFENCTSLTSITIPDSVTSIGYSAFGNCTSLTSITIPDSVTSIPYGAFQECVRLVSITIPNSVTAIEGAAFYHCESLSSISIPDSVTYIADNAFGGDNNFVIFGTPGSYAEEFANQYGIAFADPTSEEPTIAYTVLEDGYEETNQYGYAVITAIINAEGEFVLPETIDGHPIAWIESGAFFYSPKLTSLVIEDVYTLHEGVFSQCASLTSVTINKVYRLDGSVFSGCPTLSIVTFYSDPSAYLNDPFSECTDVIFRAHPDSQTIKYLVEENSLTFEVIDYDAVTIDEMIEDLGEITSLNQTGSVERVRMAYDTMSDAEKAKVTKLKMLEDAEATLKMLEARLGDVDNSGKLDVADIIRLYSAIYNGDWSEAEIEIGDFNGSGVVDVGDILAMRPRILDNMSKWGLTAPADAKTTLYAESVVALPNRELTVPLYLNNAAALLGMGDDSLGGLQLLLDYDTEALSLTGFTPAEAINGYECFVQESEDCGMLVLYAGFKKYENSTDKNYSMQLTKDMTGDTLLGYLTFKTSDSFAGADVKFELQKICDNNYNNTGTVDYTGAVGVQDLNLSLAACLHAKPEPAFPGQTVKVPVYLNNAASLMGIGDGSIGGVQFTVQYDREQVRLVGFKGADKFSGFLAEISEMDSGKHKVLLYNGGYSIYGVKLNDEMTGDLLIGYLEFKVTADITAAQVSFEIQNICDSSQSDMDMAVSYNDHIGTSACTIEKAEGTFRGDIDGTGVIDVADILKAKALIMSEDWSGEELQAGDLNASGSLDVGDIMGIKNIIMGA